VDRPVDTPADDGDRDLISHRLPTAQLVLVIVLLAAPVVALMWVSTYAKSGPKLWGFPFFFWYQFLWVFLAATCTSIAYRFVAAHTARRRDREEGR
jgi:membrane protein implicated in regulation of membrane protease activity